MIQLMDKIVETMLSGQIYDPGDGILAAMQSQRFVLLRRYNDLDPADMEGRARLLSQMFRSFGEGSYIEQPLHANWAGMFCDIGRHVYANFNLTLVDDGPIAIGDNTMIGPNVTIATASHPKDAGLRRKGLQFNRPVRIGSNCFLASGVIVCPGVSIGDDTIIGAGSVVTRDIPSGVLAFGNPCRVVESL